jgi:hypothetical protein
VVNRLLLTALVAWAIVASLVLMRRGWVRRGRSQGDVERGAPVPTIPPATERSDLTDIEARYLGASRTGDWLDRVVVHGLGAPSAARVSVRTGTSTTRGVWLDRQGATDIFVPAADVAGVRHDRAVAGRAVEPDGILVLTWQHGRSLVDLGLRVRDPERAEMLRQAIDSLAANTRTIGDRL